MKNTVKTSRANYPTSSVRHHKKKKHINNLRTTTLRRNATSLIDRPNSKKQYILKRINREVGATVYQQVFCSSDNTTNGTGIYHVVIVIVSVSVLLR